MAQLILNDAKISFDYLLMARDQDSGDYGPAAELLNKQIGDLFTECDRDKVYAQLSFFSYLDASNQAILRISINGIDKDTDADLHEIVCIRIESYEEIDALQRFLKMAVDHACYKPIVRLK